MSRVLETVLVGRNLLSPVLATAARDVTAYSSTVTAQQGKAAASAQTAGTAQARAAGTAAAATTTGAATQNASAQKIAASNVKASTSAQASAATQARAHAAAAQSATVASRTQQAANNALASSNGLLGTSLTPLTAGLGAVGLGLGYAAFRGMEFDAAMSGVQAASQASASEMANLREAAITLGADTQYSAEEAAQGITELAKAGVSTADVLGGGLKGALDLAAAGQMEVADAAEVGATALSVFRLEGSQMSHVADLLAAGAGKAQGSVHDLGMALNQSALVADQTGLSIEDTAGALAMFASNGLVGSDAGTSFKTMLQALNPNSEAAAKAMEAIGFSAYDAQGNFVGLEGVAGQLKDGLSNLTVEQQNATLKTIFGSDAVRAAAILYKEGSTGVAEWAAKVNDSGYAARQAQQLTDNLKGDLERLGGAFDSVMTTIGGGTQGTLRFLVQTLTSIIEVGGDVIGFWNSLPGPVQVAVGAFGALTLLRGPMDRLFERIAVGITSTITGMGMASGATTGFGIAADTARTAIGKLVAAAAPLVALTILTSAINSILEFNRAGDDARESIRQFNAGLEDMGNTARGQAISDEIDSITTSIEGYRQTIEAYDSQGWADKHLWYVPFGGEKSDVEDARQSLEAYERQLASLERANDRTTETTRVLADRFNLSQTEVQELADKYEIDLGGSLLSTRLRFGQLYTEEYGTTPIDAANALAGAVTSAKEQTEEAIKAQERWLESLQQVAAGFVDPLGAYGELLDEKMAKERESAEATAAATEDATDSWEDYVEDVDVSLDELADRLQEQIENQAAWRQNIGQIAQWAGADVAQHLALMGEEGVDLVAKMADGSSEEAQRMAALIREDIRLGGMEWTAETDKAMKTMAELGRQGAGATVRSIADALGVGYHVVKDQLASYGVAIADGINPVLIALGRNQVKTNARIAGGATVNSLGGGNLWEGGYTGDGGKYEPKGVVHGGEFVFTKEQTTAAGIAQLEAYANSLQGYATGGFVTSADVPRPFSTAPFRPPISTAADAAMQKGFDEVRAWLDANTEAIQGGTAGAGAVTGAWGSLWQLVKSQIPQARINSTFRAGDPGYHGKAKAIDFGFGTGPGGAGSAGLASINRLLHDQVGRNLAELIYNGIGDDRPNLKHGQPLAYSAAVQAQHRNHVHAAVRDQGGLVPSGSAAFNLSGRDEWMLSPQQTEAFKRAMESVPAAMPGYGAAFGGGGAVGAVAVTVQSGPVRVYLDGQEWRGMARVEAETVVLEAEQVRYEQRKYHR